MAIEYRNGQLELGRVALADVAKQFQTPCYVYDFDELTGRLQQLRTALNGLRHHIAFAVKANGNLALLKFLKEQGCGFDLVSLGELSRVITAGADLGTVAFSGVGKSRTELTAAVKRGVKLICVESAAELALVIEVAENLKKPAPVALRINPEIDPKTHPYIATGLKSSKFGLPIGVARELFLKHKESPHLKWSGISCHIGSQILDLEPFSQMLTALKNEWLWLQQRGITLPIIDVGGGLGIAYRPEERAPEVAAYGALIRKHLGELNVEIWLEPGRWLVGPCGALLTEVMYEKPASAPGAPSFLVLDAGMGELIRPTLYQAYHPVWPLKEAPGLATQTYDLVGPICESGDFLAKDRKLIPLKAGDLLAVGNAGAYGFVMSSNYNARPRPAEVAVRGGRCYLVRNRESHEDLIRGERLFALDAG